MAVRKRFRRKTLKPLQGGQTGKPKSEQKRIITEKDHNWIIYEVTISGFNRGRIFV